MSSWVTEPMHPGPRVAPGEGTLRYIRLAHTSLLSVTGQYEARGCRSFGAVSTRLLHGSTPATNGPASECIVSRLHGRQSRTIQKTIQELSPQY